jgi:hypothetical protein
MLGAFTTSAYTHQIGYAKVTEAEARMKTGPIASPAPLRRDCS